MSKHDSTSTIPQVDAQHRVSSASCHHRGTAEGAVSRGAEIVIMRVRHDAKAELFVQWLKGRAWSIYGATYDATASKIDPYVDVLSVARVDMFTLFAHLYRKVEVMRQRLNANVAVAVCRENECIDMSEMSWPKIVLRDYWLKKLMKAAYMVKGLIKGEKLDGISVEDRGDFIRLSAKCCNIDLQIDEAVLVARWLLGELYLITKSEVISHIRDKIATVFDTADVAYLPDISLRHVDKDVYALSIEWCGEVHLTADEILQLVYRIIDAAVSRLKTWKKHETVELLKAEAERAWI